MNEGGSAWVPVAGLLVLGGIIGAAYFGWSQGNKEGDQLDKDVVQPYLQLVSESKFEDALTSYASSKFRSTYSSSQLSEAYTERRDEWGAIVDWERRRIDSLSQDGQHSTRILYGINFERERGTVIAFDLVDGKIDESHQLNIGRNTMVKEPW